MSSTAPAPSVSKPLSQAERVIDTFIAPSKTFTDIRRDSSWWVPWLLGAIVGLVLVAVVDQKVGMTRVAENDIQQSAKATERLDSLPADQRAAQVELSAKITRYFAYGSPVLSLIIVAIIAGVLMATFNFGLGQEVKFPQAVAISMYAFLPGIIKALLAIVVIFATGGESFSFRNQVASNLGPLVDVSSGFLHSLATSIDVFNIWILILTAIGYTCITRVKLSTCLAVVFGWWAVVTLITSAIGSLFG
jgi:hypothetical protein